MYPDAVSLLRDVDAYMFDVFGTTVDWFTTVKRHVARRSDGAQFHGKRGASNTWFNIVPRAPTRSVRPILASLAMTLSFPPRP